MSASQNKKAKRIARGLLAAAALATCQVATAQHSEQMTGTGTDYRGFQTKTKDGETCLHWKLLRDKWEGTPDLELRPWMKNGFEEKGLGDHNHCRNPDSGSTIWCYYEDKANGQLGWNWCNPKHYSAAEAYYVATELGLNAAPPSEDINGKGADYVGVQTRTKSGKTCLNWTSKEVFQLSGKDIPLQNFARTGAYGIGDHNYCRNPTAETTGDTIWCYVDDDVKRWDYCDPKDTAAANHLDESTADEGLHYRGFRTSGGFIPTGQESDQEEAKKVAREHGLELGGMGTNGKRYAFAGNYGTKGLYAYESGPYKGLAFFGISDDATEMLKPVKSPQYRLGVKACVNWTTVKWDYAREKALRGEDGLGDHNYCRNWKEDGKYVGGERPWCYSDNVGNWGYCDLPTKGLSQAIHSDLCDLGAGFHSDRAKGARFASEKFPIKGLYVDTIPWTSGRGNVLNAGCAYFGIDTTPSNVNTFNTLPPPVVAPLLQIDAHKNQNYLNNLTGTRPIRVDTISPVVYNLASGLFTQLIFPRVQTLAKGNLREYITDNPTKIPVEMQARIFSDKVKAKSNVGGFGGRIMNFATNVGGTSNPNNKRHSKKGVLGRQLEGQEIDGLHTLGRSDADESVAGKEDEKADNEKVNESAGDVEESKIHSIVKRFKFNVEQLKP